MEVVLLEFKFFHSTWLQSTIESNTQSELIGVYEQWKSFASSSISWARAYSQDLFYWRDGQKMTFALFDSRKSDNVAGKENSQLINAAKDTLGPEPESGLPSARSASDPFVTDPEDMVDEIDLQMDNFPKRDTQSDR